MTEISTLDELSAKATGGEWACGWNVGRTHYCVYPANEGKKLSFPVAHMPDFIKRDVNEANAAFIVAAVNTIRRLLAHPEDRAAIERVNK